jgi:hypothetical protein
MKKHVLTFIILTIFLKANAQSLFKGFGVFGSLTQSAHYYNNLDTDKKTNDSLPFKYFYPQTHHSKEFFSWGAGVFLELSRKGKVRWQTELEYCNKGANERELTNAITGARAASFQANKFTYIQWNNYAKFYYPAGFSYWYFMAGVRLEYLYSKSATVFTSVSGSFPTFWFSGDLALGYEYPFSKRYSLFTEYHLNPDVLSHKHDNTNVMNRTLELRAGIVMRPKKKSIDDCNAPVYRGGAF